MRVFAVKKLLSEEYLRTLFDPEDGPSIRWVGRDKATWFAREKDALSFGLSMTTVVEEFQADG